MLSFLKIEFKVDNNKLHNVIITPKTNYKLG